MTTPESNKKRPYVLWLIVAILAAALFWYLHTHVAFDWKTLGVQLRAVDLRFVLGAIALIYVSFWLRAVRWAILLAPVKRVPSRELVASQLIGFSAVALIGRIADLSRPYLIARKVKVPVASQLAIYSIERAFDLGAAAILFSVTLAFAPHNLPHHETYLKAGKGALALTSFIVIFALALRFAGETVAHLSRTLLSPLSKPFAEKLSERILEFRDGLRTVSTLREFLAALAVSLLMWGGISGCYLVSARAFVADPTLAHFSFTQIMLVFAVSLGGSLLQLPIVGWFTQIGIIALSFHGFFSVPNETATACAAVIFFSSSLSIIPAGLIAAKLEGTSLRGAVKEAEAPQPEI
jgi:glycosyltransferase 2 family protein